jgi:hypothetical protein
MAYKQLSDNKTQIFSTHITELAIEQGIFSIKKVGMSLYTS